MGSILLLASQCIWLYTYAPVLLRPSFPSEDAPALRWILLTAAAHYASKSGGLHDYEQTFRFHMVQSIDMLNSWIKNDIGTSTESLLSCAKFVTALCIIEVWISTDSCLRSVLELACY